MLGPLLWTQLVSPLMGDFFDLSFLATWLHSAELFPAQEMVVPNLNLRHVPPGGARVGDAGRD